MTTLDGILSQWVRLGAMFNVQPARQTPDLEPLLIDTTSVLPSFARLHAMSVSWLARYYRLICRHRLAAMVRQVEDAVQSAVLGYLLTAAAKRSRTDHFNLAIHTCRPLTEPRPLFETYLRNPAMIALAERQADPAAKRWGLWTPPERLYADAVRPTEWIMRNNPSLRFRAMFRGQLSASILAMLRNDPRAGKSESALSRTCRATRKAIRDALDHLELCQLVRRQRVGRALHVLPVERDDSNFAR